MHISFFTQVTVTWMVKQVLLCSMCDFKFKVLMKTHAEFLLSLLPVGNAAHKCCVQHANSYVATPDGGFHT
jgi:hypothetical protein